MKQNKKPSKPIFRLLYFAAILFLLSWILLWGQNSFFRTWNTKRKVDALEEQVNALKAKNDSLTQENYRLKTSPDAAEKVAREKFGFTRDNEKVFRFVQPDDKKPSTSKQGE